VTTHNGEHEALPAPVCLAEPQPGDFCCVPISGDIGRGIEVGQYLASKLQHQPAELLPYEHAMVYVGLADEAGPHGYTYSAYPKNGKQGDTGKRALPCPPAQLPGSLWSSGLYDLTSGTRAGIVSWCILHGDVGYSFLDYDAIATRALHIPAPGLKTYIGSTGHLICSQYTDMSWSLGGNVQLFDDKRWPGYVTPWDLAAELLARVRQRDNSTW
jgi:hypothetical protein